MASLTKLEAGGAVCSEKKHLNAINKGSSNHAGKQHAVRFCVPDPNKPQKTKERISTGPEKIFIMVRE